MRRILMQLTLLALLLTGLPLLGVAISGKPVGRYLAFPPETGYVIHAPFSWPAFILYSLLLLCFLLPLTLHAARHYKRGKTGQRSSRPFPWWGWASLLMGCLSWFMAWTRFDWFRPFQMHTFTPLWLSFVLTINGLCYRRNGHCLMLDRPVYFLLLFPASGLFWWFFEYLNRFVGNWSYVETPVSGWSYFWRATVPFSTVLPAVLATREWLSEMSWIQEGFKDFIRIDLGKPRIWASTALAAAVLGLMGIGVWPDYLFSLLWISPLFVLTAIQVLSGEQTVFSDIAAGDWRLVISSAAAALFCGWFWEMWNYWSLARWTYHIPFVDRFKVFEMPVLGFGGYLPFGLECAAVGIFLEGLIHTSKHQLN